MENVCRGINLISHQSRDGEGSMSSNHVPWKPIEQSEFDL